MEWKAGAICHPLVIQKRGEGEAWRGSKPWARLRASGNGNNRNRSCRRFSGDKDFTQCRAGGRVNRAQQTPLNQFHKVKKCLGWLITHGKTPARSPWGLRFTTDTNIAGENQQGIKWPEAHRERHSWAPTSFKKNQLLSPVVENQQTWWLGRSVTDYFLFLFESSGQENKIIWLWRSQVNPCTKLSRYTTNLPWQFSYGNPIKWLPGGWPKEENQPIQNI